MWGPQGSVSLCGTLQITPQAPGCITAEAYSKYQTWLSCVHRHQDVDNVNVYLSKPLSVAKAMAHRHHDLTVLEHIVFYLCPIMAVVAATQVGVDFVPAITTRTVVRVYNHSGCWHLNAQIRLRTKATLVGTIV